MNINALRSDLRRYGKATFKVQGSNYEVSGNVQQGYTLWLLSRAAYGFKRDIITTFSALHEIEEYLEQNTVEDDQFDTHEEKRGEK